MTIYITAINLILFYANAVKIIPNNNNKCKLDINTSYMDALFLYNLSHSIIIYFLERIPFFL